MRLLKEFDFGNVKILVLGGWGTIGGNAVYIRDEGRGINLLFDYGVNFSAFNRFYEFPFLLPDSYKEMVYLNVIPDPSPIDEHLDLLAISHLHTDHYKYFPAVKELNPAIGKLNVFVPIKDVLEAKMIYRDYRSSRRSSRISLEDFRRENVFLSDDPSLIASLGIRKFVVDHSVVPAYSYLYYSSEGSILYTGDFRLLKDRCEKCPFRDRCYLARMFEKEGFENWVKNRDEEIDVVISEGTNVGNVNEPFSEANVRREFINILDNADGLVLVFMSGMDLERMLSLVAALDVLNLERKLVLIDYQNAILVHKMLVGGYKELLSRFVLYVFPFSYREPPSIISGWQKVSLDEIVRNPQDYIVIGYWRMLSFIKNLFMMVRERRIKLDGLIVHSTSEPHNESDEVKFDRIIYWANILGFPIFHIHASGHISALELKNILEKLKPKKIIPVHTEHPLVFRQMFKNIEIVL